MIFEILHGDLFGTLALKYMNGKNVQSIYFLYTSEKCEELFSNWKDCSQNAFDLLRYILQIYITYSYIILFKNLYEP